MILCIWILALVATIPWLLYFQLKPKPGYENVLMCMEDWPEERVFERDIYYLVVHLIACYLLPTILISLCYILIWIKVWQRSIPGDSRDAQIDRMQQKSKMKVVKMLVVVVILFVLSWLPLYVLATRSKFYELSEKEYEMMKSLIPIAQMLGFSNSCINPILYAFFNKKYRLGFAAIIRSRKCCGRLR